MVIPFGSFIGLTLMTLLPTMVSPVVCLMNSNEGTVHVNTEGVRLSRLGCAVIRLHWVSKVSSGERLMIQN